MATTSVLEEATNFKARGNECFCQGNLKESIANFDHGLELVDSVLSGTEGSCELKERLALAQLALVLHSNSSNVHLQTEAWQKAERSASSALDVAKTHDLSAELRLKPAFRLATALRAQGRCFAAFVVAFHHSSINGSDTPEWQKLRRELNKAIGLSNVDEGFSCEEIAPGSFGTIATSKITHGQRIFLEQGLALGVKADRNHDEDDENGATEALVLHFAAQLRVIQEKGSDDVWRSITTEMDGSWPRSIEAIDSSVRTPLEAAMRKQHPTVEQPQFNELFHLALRCRYNCFHSGFFRVCALINHSCRPNAAMKYQAKANDPLAEMLGTRSSSGEVNLVAVTNINAKERVTVKYLSDTDYLMGVMRRRELLYQSWLFVCACPRCTEDMDVSAKCEWIRCGQTVEGKRCEGFLHMPFPSENIESRNLPADIGPSQPSKCTSCSKPAEFVTGQLQRLWALRATCLDLIQRSTSSDQISLHALYDEITRCRRELRAEVHDDHHLHRIALYAFVVAGRTAIDNLFTLCFEDYSEEKQLGVVTALGVDQYAIDAEDCGTKVNVLNYLIRLWKAIQPFYPESQGYVLHVTIVEVATVLLVFAAKGSKDDVAAKACQIIKEYVGFLDSRERSQFNQKLAAHPAVAKTRFAKMATKVFKG